MQTDDETNLASIGRLVEGNERELTGQVYSQEERLRALAYLPVAIAAFNAGGPNTGKAVGWAASSAVDWDRGPWTWLWWFGDANQTFYYVPDILGCEATK